MATSILLWCLKPKVPEGGPRASATVPSGTIVECSKACLGPLDPGTVVLEIPEGFLRGQETKFLNLPAHPFFDHFFDIVLGS